MHWILQNNIYSEEGWDKLVTALDRLGISYSVHKYLPFVGTLDPDPTPPPGKVIVMGSYTLAREAQKRGWEPGVFLNDNFDFEKQQPHWKGLMINGSAWVGPFSEVPVQIDPFFIRPTEDSKAFTGFVTDWPSFTEWRAKVMQIEQYTEQLKPHTRVMVCPKKDIAREYRCWIVDEKVVTASLYKTGTRKHYQECTEQRIIEFAEECARVWSPCRAYVLDVFQTHYPAYANKYGD